MLLRMLISVILGVIVSLGLLFAMQYMVKLGKEVTSEEKELRYLDFVRQRPEEVVNTKERKPEKPPEPQEPPPDIPPPSQDSLDPGGDVIAVAPVSVSADVNVGGIGLVASDGDYLPIVKVAPIYPRRAQSRGIEGYVIVEFTVTKTGAVRDPVVVESTSSLFERAAVNAALKFKYKPRVVNGEPIEVAGVRNKITFQLED